MEVNAGVFLPVSVDNDVLGITQGKCSWLLKMCSSTSSVSSLPTIVSSLFKIAFLRSRNSVKDFLATLRGGNESTLFGEEVRGGEGRLDLGESALGVAGGMGWM